MRENRHDDTHHYRGIARGQIERLEIAIEAFHSDMGRYPERLDELRAQPRGAASWDGPYLKKDIPNDPWDHPFEYSRRVEGQSSTDYLLASRGPDNELSTEDDVTLSPDVR